LYPIQAIYIPELFIHLHKPCYHCVSSHKTAHYLRDVRIACRPVTCVRKSTLAPVVTCRYGISTHFLTSICIHQCFVTTTNHLLIVFRLCFKPNDKGTKGTELSNLSADTLNCTAIRFVGCNSINCYRAR
jgi:hypothetical protein